MLLTKTLLGIAKNALKTVAVSVILLYVEGEKLNATCVQNPTIYDVLDTVKPLLSQMKLGIAISATTISSLLAPKLSKLFKL